MDVEDEMEQPDEMACESGESSDEYMSDNESVAGTTNTPSLGETDAALLGQYFLVQGGVRLKVVGTTAVVNFICMECSAAGKKQWESQDRTVSHRSERAYKGNVEAAVSAITTGLRYLELARWAELMKLAIFSRTFFWKVFVWAKPAIEKVYPSQQSLVFDLVKSAYKQGTLGFDRESCAGGGAY